MGSRGVLEAYDKAGQLPPRSRRGGEASWPLRLIIELMRISKRYEKKLVCFEGMAEI